MFVQAGETFLRVYVKHQNGLGQMHLCAGIGVAGVMMLSEQNQYRRDNL
jgi:hypothetical protein